ncbi:hypothetical protein PV08_06045 [Exophiala spinifera]|uniref:Uncharacterized protein n=1 Tax=Exophiala spinifera TaxID=91928 RepID=A0A0D2BXJ7_9EURO|nr:uncharacterized protein PV08_06045 [Exophiala spinifera]KIW15994.1 hypothetical protein PV08_06045 [Exophiala spinifera]
MQDYMREKRWQARVRANSSDESESTAQSRQKKLALQSRTRQQKPSNESARNCDLPRTAKALSSLANSQGIDDPRNLSFETVQEAPYHASEHRVKGLKRSRFYLDATAFAKLFDLEQNHSEASSNRPSILLSTDFSCSPWFQAGQFSQPQSMLSAARTDPFDSLLITLSHEDEQLFDFYATVIPAYSYGLEKPPVQNWFLSVWQELYALKTLY